MRQRIDVCICTYRRPSLKALLYGLAQQKLGVEIALRIIVADNDHAPSAQDLVSAAARDMPWPVLYVHAPAGNISVARNACLDHATADWVAFVDDDETVPDTWIASLLCAAEIQSVDGVFAPSKALYPSDAPKWMRHTAPHCNLPQSRRVVAAHCANAILRYKGTPWECTRFRQDLGQSGGEDTAYFAAVERRGARLIAVDHPVVTEPVDRARLSLRWLAQRRFREGQTHFDIFLKNEGVRPILSAIGKAAICLILSGLCLPLPKWRNGWLLRGIRQIGIITASFNQSRLELYGKAPTVLGHRPINMTKNWPE